jgi:hypothetical protein
MPLTDANIGVTHNATENAHTTRTTHTPHVRGASHTYATSHVTLALPTRNFFCTLHITMRHMDTHHTSRLCHHATRNTSHLCPTPYTCAPHPNRHMDAHHTPHVTRMHTTPPTPHVGGFIAVADVHTPDLAVYLI